MGIGRPFGKFPPIGERQAQPVRLRLPGKPDVGQMPFAQRVQPQLGAAQSFHRFDELGLVQPLRAPLRAEVVQPVEPEIMPEPRIGQPSAQFGHRFPPALPFFVHAAENPLRLVVFLDRGPSAANASVPLIFPPSVRPSCLSSSVMVFNARRSRSAGRRPPPGWETPSSPPRPAAPPFLETGEHAPADPVGRLPPPCQMRRAAIEESGFFF